MCAVWVYWAGEPGAETEVKAATVTQVASEAVVAVVVAVVVVVVVVDEFAAEAWD